MYEYLPVSESWRFVSRATVTQVVISMNFFLKLLCMFRSREFLGDVCYEIYLVPVLLHPPSCLFICLFL